MPFGLHHLQNLWHCLHCFQGRPCKESADMEFSIPQNPENDSDHHLKQCQSVCKDDGHTTHQLILTDSFHTNPAIGLWKSWNFKWFFGSTVHGTLDSKVDPAAAVTSYGCVLWTLWGAMLQSGASYTLTVWKLNTWKTALAKHVWFWMMRISQNAMVENFIACLAWVIHHNQVQVFQQWAIRFFHWLVDNFKLSDWCQNEKWKQQMLTMPTCTAWCHGVQTVQVVQVLSTCHNEWWMGFTIWSPKNQKGQFLESWHLHHLHHSAEHFWVAVEWNWNFRKCLALVSQRILFCQLFESTFGGWQPHKICHWKQTKGSQLQVCNFRFVPSAQCFGRLWLSNLSPMEVVTSWTTGIFWSTRTNQCVMKPQWNIADPPNKVKGGVGQSCREYD